MLNFKIRFPLWMAILVFVFYGPVSAEKTKSPVASTGNPFLILTDVTGSMRERIIFGDESGERRVSKARIMKTLLLDIFMESAPPVCETGIYQLKYVPGKKEVCVPFIDIGHWNRMEVLERTEKGFETDFSSYNNLTFFGRAFGELDEKIFKSLNGQITVLLISDGIESFYDPEAESKGPLGEIRRIKKKYGAGFSLHTVFVGEKKKGHAGEILLKKMSKAGSGKHFNWAEVFRNRYVFDKLLMLACINPVDTDDDGIPDDFDKCPETPPWVSADEAGCPGCRGNTPVSMEKTDDAIPTPLDDWQPGPPLMLDCANQSDERSGFIFMVENGETFYHKGDFGSSARIWEQTLTHGDAEKDICKYTETLLRLSYSYLAVGKHKKAIETIHASLPAVEKAGDPNLLALIYSALADIYLSLGQTGESMMYHGKVFEIVNSVTNHRIFANVLLNAANALAATGDYEAAMSYYQAIMDYKGESLEQDLEIDTKQRSKTLLNVMRIKSLTGNYSEIGSLVKDSYFEILNQPDSVIKSADLIAFSILCDEIRNNLLQKTERNKPVEFKMESNSGVNVRIPEGFILKKLEGRDYSVYFELGGHGLSKYDKPMLDEIASVLNDNRDSTIHIHIKGHTDAVPVSKSRNDFRCNMDLSLKRIESVEEYLIERLGASQTEKSGQIWKYGLETGIFSSRQRAEKMGRRLKTKNGLEYAIAEKISGNRKHYIVCAGEFESSEAALEFSSQTLKRKYPAKKIRMIQSLKTQNGMVFLKEARGCYDPLVENSLSVFGTPQNRRVDITITSLETGDDQIGADLENIGTGGHSSYVETEKYSLEDLRQETLYGKSPRRYLTEMSWLALKKARKISNNLHIDRMLAEVNGYMSRMYKHEKRDEKAFNLTRRAVEEAGDVDSPEILYKWQWQLAKMHKDKGEVEKAVPEYRKTIATLDPIRYKFFQGYRSRRNVFKESVKPVYLELAEILLEQADALPEGEARQKKLREARDVVEMLKASELENFFRDGCFGRKIPSLPPPNKSPAQTAIIHPIVLPEKLALLTTLPDGMHLTMVPVDGGTLEHTVSSFRKKLQNRTNNRFLWEAEQLYHWIVRPIETELVSRKVHTLCFAPDGVLRLVPMSTLYDGESFLVEKFAISIIPFMKLVDFESASRPEHRILLSGVSDARQEFSALPSVTGELSDIKTIMDGEGVLINGACNAENLGKAIDEKEYTIFHMATHGVFGGTPEDSFLMTYDGRLTMNALEELVEKTKYRKNPIELLTLSACQTALGNERAAMGLAGVAVKAGVKSALATLWYVDDEATSLAIREFYRQLKTPGITKAAALQNAQKKLIERPRYWHALYWGPFVLIGNWM